MIKSNATPLTIEKISPRVGLELATARSVDQRLTPWATGAPQREKGSVATKALRVC